MNEYQENPFESGAAESQTAGKNSRQSGYTPFITGKISNENIAHKAMDYIHDEIKAQYGILGKFFGTEKNASKNITFIILAFILLIFCILMFWADYCKIITHSFILCLLDKLLPLFTLAFGYFFGKQ
jgi:hypothetical protein